MSENPIVRYDSEAEGGQLDEFIAFDVESVHFEAMSNNTWWIGIVLHDGRMWAINCGALNGRTKAYAHCEED